MTQKGALRQAIDRWLTDNPISNGFQGFAKRIAERQTVVNGLVIEFTKQPFPMVMGGLIPFMVVSYAYVLTGAQPLLTILNFLTGKALTRTGEDLFVEAIKQAVNTPQMHAITEAIGTIVTEPILSLLEQEAMHPSPDPKTFARKFHGIMAALTAAGGVASIGVEAKTAGQIENVGGFLQSLYWNLGLGFLGWQTLAPLLETALQPRLQQYYLSSIRPTRFSASQLRDLLALGEIDRSTILEELKNMGWRDQDIDKWIKLAYRTLSEARVLDAYQRGILDESETIRRLRSLGYSPDDIKLILTLERKPELQDVETVTISTARSAFKNHLISEAEFRELLKSLKRSDREIDLIIAIERGNQEQQIRSLTINQIKDAYQNNVIKRPEAVHWLKNLRFSDDEIAIIMATWDAELTPKVRTVNLGTITGAYIAGILNRSQAQQKLISIGYNPEDADLELDLTEARHPEAFGAAKPKTTRLLMPAELSDLSQAGLITHDEMVAGLITLGYTAADAEKLADLADAKREEQKLPMTVRMVERAYIAGVYNRSRAYSKLIELGYTDEDAETTLQTVEKENPAVFYPESVQSYRTPTINALVDALLKEIITEDEYIARAQEIGYNRADAELYMVIAKTAPRKPVKSLSASQILEAYRKFFFDHGTALQRLTELGYSDADASLLLQMEIRDITKTDIWKDMLAGKITPEDAIAQLIAAGFTMDEINAAIAKMS